MTSKNDFSNIYPNSYDKTGNLAVDLIASMTTYYRGANKKIERIILNHLYYELFLEFVKKFQEIALDTILSFEGIDVLKSEEDFEEPLQISFINE